MCLNCGCGEPENDQGRAENLTIDELRKAAEANSQSLRESAQHILDTVIAYEARTPRSEATDRDRAGLAQPAGRQPAPPAGRGTPDSES